MVQPVPIFALKKILTFQPAGQLENNINIFSR